MKRYAWITLLLIFIAIPGYCLSDLTLKTGFQYDAWENDNNEEGAQFFMPVDISGGYDNFSCRLLTAYVYSSYENTGVLDVSMGNMTDTKVNLSYEITGKYAFDILFGLDFNLPTGKTDLSTDRLNLIMDADLVSITSFGEGFNVNPSVSVVKQWDKLTAGMGIGYLWRGEYDFSENTKNYDPGDIWILNGRVTYDISGEWQAMGTVKYADYGIDQVESADFYEEGNFLEMGAGVGYFRPKWDAVFTVRSIARDKEKIPSPTTGLLVSETNNSRGDEWVLNQVTRFHMDDKTTLSVMLQYLNIDSNDYPSTHSLFTGKRDKYSLGFSASRKLLPGIDGAFTLKGFNLEEDRNPDHPTKDISYDGYSIGVSITASF